MVDLVVEQTKPPSSKGCQGNTRARSTVRVVDAFAIADVTRSRMAWAFGEYSDSTKTQLKSLSRASSTTV